MATRKVVLVLRLKPGTARVFGPLPDNNSSGGPGREFDPAIVDADDEVDGAGRKTLFDLLGPAIEKLVEQVEREVAYPLAAFALGGD